MKKQSNPSKVVDDLLADCPMPKKRNLIAEQHPELGAAIERFLELKASNDDRVCGITLSWFYDNKLRPKFNGPSAMDTVRKYVRQHLNRDPKTGAKLDG